jgi:hypothetical protein
MSDLANHPNLWQLGKMQGLAFEDLLEVFGFSTVDALRRWAWRQGIPYQDHPTRIGYIMLLQDVQEALARERPHAMRWREEGVVR